HSEHTEQKQHACEPAPHNPPSAHGLRNDLLHDLSIHCRGALRPALVKKSQLAVIQAELVEDRGLQIVGIHNTAHRAQADLIGSAVTARLDAAAGNPGGISPGIVIAAVASLTIRCAPEL